MRAKIVSGIAVLAMTMVSYGVTNTWTGTADGNWSNVANWVDGAIPVDNAPGTGNDAGLSMVYTDLIVFNGTSAPTTNFPGIGGNANGGKDSPTMQFNSGGTFDFSVVGRDVSFWRNTAGTTTLLTVGDGVGTDDVTVNILGLNYLSRHNNDVVNNFLVNSDGTLTFDGNVKFVYPGTTTRNASFTIAGGDVVVNGEVTGLGQNAESFVDFTTTNGSFTAEFGSLMSDFAAVQASEVWKNNSGGVLEFTTNATSFTVSAVYSALLPAITVSTNAGVFPLEVVFDGSGSEPSADIVAYNWDFGDGNTNSGSVVTNTYTTDGEFVATLTILDASSNSKSTTVSIEVAGPATNITLVADAANSSTAFYGTSVANLLTDTFDYDPIFPTATLPSLDYTDGFHGNGDTGYNVVSFTLSNAYTTVSTYPVIGVDLWGRDANQDRDDNIDVILYNGDYSTEVGRVEGIAIPSGAAPYARAIIDTLAIGTTFDRMQIIGHHNQFTLTEVRLAAVWGELAAVSADISASTNVGKPPLEVVFDGSGSIVLNGPATYDWDFGDGNTDSGVLVTNTYLSNGVYSVLLTVTDANSDSASNSVEIVVKNTDLITTAQGSGSAKTETFPVAFTPFSTNDLVQVGQSTLLSVEQTGVPDVTNLINGITGDADNNGQVALIGASPADTVTFNLDVSESALGYDITAIQTFAGWNPAAKGRSNQGYTMTVTYLDDTTEELASGTHYANGLEWNGTGWDDVGTQYTWTEVIWSNTTGVIASGVKSITFNDFDFAGPGGDVGYREFDVIGTPTAPTDGPTLVVTNGTTIVWFSPVLQNFDVEYKDNLVTDENWMFYTNITGTTPTTSFEMPVDEAAERFFRVLLND